MLNELSVRLRVIITTFISLRLFLICLGSHSGHLLFALVLCSPVLLSCPCPCSSSFLLHPSGVLFTSVSQEATRWPRPEKSPGVHAPGTLLLLLTRLPTHQSRHLSPVFPTGLKLHEVRASGLCPCPLCPQCPKQCLAHGHVQ